MPISSIADHARSCLDRDYLLRWFPDNVRVDKEQFGFSEAELAVVEEALRSLSRNQSLLIHNPLPGNRIPIAICLAYIRSQDPRFPTQGIIGRGDSMFALPALNQGYLSTIDDAELDGIGRSPGLIDRQPIGALSEWGENADLYTAKHGFEFDRDGLAPETGAVFVDLRKPEWGLRNRRFREILGLFEAADCPFIFYTDEITDEAATLQEELNTVEVTSELLMTAKGMSVPNPGQTAQFGHLLSEEEFSLEHISVGFPEMKAVVQDMVQMKNDLQKRGIARIEVGWLFNLLTKLPVRPEHWDDVTASNYYQQGVRELLENLRQKAPRLDGSKADLLINYCHAADHLHGLLNQSHPVQEELFELIRETEEKELDRAFAVRGEFERDAVLRAITIEDGPSLSFASIREIGEIEAGEFDEVVVCRPLDYDSYVYEFPLAKSLKFLQFESWAEVVERRIDRGLDVLNADIEMRKVGRFEQDEPEPDPQPGQGAPSAREEAKPASASSADREVMEPEVDSAEPVDDYVPDVEGASEEEVIETLEQEFKQSSRPTGSRESGSSGGSADLQFELSNGEIRTASSHTRTTILRENGDIGRIKAGDLSEGDTVVLVESAAEDIYDIFLESAHDKEKIRKCESVVERWHDTLRDGLEEMSAPALLDEIQDRGSEITDPDTVEMWADGSAIGPRDPEDVRRVLAVLDPEMEPTWEATVQAMKDIRTEHRQIGKQARKAIESKMSSSMAAELTESLDGGLDQSEVRKTEVENIREI